MAEPKKATVRISLLQKPETMPGLQNDGARHDMARILPQKPLMGPAITQMSPVTVAPSSLIGAFDAIPGWLCWGLLGISALIFLIQIWNYTLS